MNQKLRLTPQPKSVAPSRGSYFLDSLFLGLTPQAKYLSPLRASSPGDEMDLSGCHPEGAKRVGGSLGNSADPHPTHRLVLSEAEGRVEWIPPLARVARSVGMTRWGPHLLPVRDHVGGLAGDEPLERRRRERKSSTGKRESPPMCFASRLRSSSRVTL